MHLVYFLYCELCDQDICAMIIRCRYKLYNACIDIGVFHYTIIDFNEVDIIQLLTIEAFPPRSILVFSGRYHIMSNASIVNNCFI